MRFAKFIEDVATAGVRSDMAAALGRVLVCRTAELRKAARIAERAGIPGRKLGREAALVLARLEAAA